MITTWLLHLQALSSRQEEEEEENKQTNKKGRKGYKVKGEANPVCISKILLEALLLTSQNCWPLFFDGDQTKRNFGWVSNAEYSTSSIHLVLFSTYQESTMCQAFYWILGAQRRERPIFVPPQVYGLDGRRSLHQIIRIQ